MNLATLIQIVRLRSVRVSWLVCAALIMACPVYAGESKEAATTTATTEEPEYKNWIELGIGGLIIHGDEAQFKQEHGKSGDVFGGIEDMHFEQTMGKNGLFSVDAHAILDNHDYNVVVNLNQPDLGYVRFGYTEFRTWYDGNGGFFPVNGQFIAPANPEMALDRGE